MTKAVTTCVVIACWWSSLWLVVPVAASAAGQPLSPAASPRVANAAREASAASSSAKLSTLHWRELPRPETVPSNLHVEGGHLRRVVERMWQGSPTFRRQCARLEQAALPVTVQVGVLRSNEIRALSRVERDRGRLKDAQVFIGRTSRTAELIAHELEHVLEQLDGIDLALQVQHGGARRVEQDQYETHRAVEVGRRVAREVRHHQEPRCHGSAACGR